MPSPELGGGHATARVHHASRRRGRSSAARGTGAAAGAAAAHRRADEFSQRAKRPRKGRLPRFASGCMSWAGWRVKTRKSRQDGPRARPSYITDLRRNWSRSRPTLSWPPPRQAVRALAYSNTVKPVAFPPGRRRASPICCDAQLPSAFTHTLIFGSQAATRTRRSPRGCLLLEALAKSAQILREAFERHSCCCGALGPLMALSCKQLRCTDQLTLRPLTE